MHLNSNFIVYMMGEHQMIIPVTDQNFKGFIRNNKTAGEIVEMLKSDVSKEEIVNRLFNKYEASREQIDSDVEKVLKVLRQIDALVE